MRGLIAITMLMTLLFLASCSQPTDEITKQTNTEGNTSTNAANANTSAAPVSDAPCTENSVPCGLHLDGDDHEPPIGSGRGSFFLDIPHLDPGPIFYRLEAASSAGPGGYFDNKIKTSNPPFDHIESVVIMTEQENGAITFKRYDYKPSDKVRLLLWLAPTGSTPCGAGPATVIINGDGGGSIKTKMKIEQSAATGKKKRPKRFEENGAPKNKSIVKWQIVTPADVVLKEDSCDDMYYIYVNFGHPA